MSVLHAALISPAAELREVTLDSEEPLFLDTLRELVDGYVTLIRLDESAVLYVSDDGAHLPVNEAATALQRLFWNDWNGSGEPVRGNAVLLGKEGLENTSAPAGAVEKLRVLAGGSVSEPSA